jgi:hypothetical protein
MPTSDASVNQIFHLPQQKIALLIKIGIELRICWLCIVPVVIPHGPSYTGHGRITEWIEAYDRPDPLSEGRGQCANGSPSSPAGTDIPMVDWLHQKNCLSQAACVA